MDGETVRQLVMALTRIEDRLKEIAKALNALTPPKA